MNYLQETKAILFLRITVFWRRLCLRIMIEKDCFYTCGDPAVLVGKRSVSQHDVVLSAGSREQAESHLAEQRGKAHLHSHTPQHTFQPAGPKSGQ